LDFIDKDASGPERFYLSIKQRRIGGELKERRLAGKVDREVRIQARDKGGFTGLPGT
jgi:hypothetical protein